MALLISWLKPPARKYAFLFAACSALPARSLLTGVVVQARMKRHGSNEGRERCSPSRREGASPLAAGSKQRLSPWGWRAGVGDFRCRSSMGKRQNSRPVSLDELTEGAKARATSLVEEFVPTLATEEDMRCIEERQLRHRAGTTIGVSPPCRHGFPQAFAFDPCGHKISSGLFRLSCPFLVKAIDELEDEGGIEDVNKRLEVDGELREDFMTVNLVHGELRRRLLTSEKLRQVEESMGKEAAERFVGSGITGVTPGKVRDAKCLHAHVADALMRGRETNAIGKQTLELLALRGVQTDGGDRCREQCDFRVAETPDSWRYTPQKNKQRLLLKKIRRKGAKQARGPRTDGLMPERKEVLVGQGVRGSISDGKGAAIRDFEPREGRDGW